MINFKQQELIEEFFQTIKQAFPEVELINVTESPEDPNDLCVNVTAPEDEDREIAMIELAGDKTADMLLDYGYYILICRAIPNLSNRSLPNYRSNERRGNGKPKRILQSFQLAEIHSKKTV